MTIKVGDRLPDGTFRVMKDGKPVNITDGMIQLYDVVERLCDLAGKPGPFNRQPH